MPPCQSCCLGRFIERAPRYFQIIFLALHDQLVRKHKEVANRELLIRKLRGIGESINIPEGGRWGADARHDEVTRTSAVIAEAFADMQETDPTRARWITQFAAILTASLTEQSSYDFKIGFVRLDGSNSFDEQSFERILENLVGIANLGKGRRGYVIIGVADTKSDADRVEQLYRVQANRFYSFYITGVDHEAGIVSRDIDTYLQMITRRISESGISPPLKDYILRHIRLIRYFDKSVLVLESRGVDDHSNIGGKYFVREGNSLKEIDPSELVSFIRTYQREKPGT